MFWVIPLHHLTSAGLSSVDASRVLTLLLEWCALQVEPLCILLKLP